MYPLNNGRSPRNTMKRIHNIDDPGLPNLQWLSNGAVHDSDGTSNKRQKQPVPSTSYSSIAMAPVPHSAPGASEMSNGRQQHGPIRSGEEIAALFMQVADKMERCWDFDIQRYLSMYRGVRLPEVNFPEAAMLIACAAQIYGRKVDYLSDIVIHMNQDQKTREQKAEEEKGGKEPEPETPDKSVGRKRVGRFNPQTLSDCFGDLEFTCNDKKLLKLEALIKPVETVDVDRRTKVQQMQDLCTELRANPSRQRRQEILNRLRDDACIAPLMSSHGAARKNQILDLESGETIGTRYDYQVHLNYIDGRTGALMAEHDLKRYFQRCDVIDFLFEHRETEQDRCSQLGIAAPTDTLSQQERELKLYMPPEYLKSRYRIDLHNTSDFDNALIQARVSNYNSDPILSLMDHGARERETAELRDSAVSSPAASPDHTQALDGGKENEDSKSFDKLNMEEHDVSFENVLTSSRLNETDARENSALLTSTELESPEQSTLSKDESPFKQSTLQESGMPSSQRLSVDEGIGVDRESPVRCELSPLEESKSKPVVFTTGIVFPRPTVLRPVKLTLNILGIPEEHVRKHVQFTLPNEYRKLKNMKQRETAEQAMDSPQRNVYSLQPSEGIDRPSTPDLEDFLGFEDEPSPAKSKVKKEKSNPRSTESSPVKQKRPSSPYAHPFEGFDDEEIKATRKATTEWMKHFPQAEKKTGSPRRTTGTGSQPVTPTRTLSCDSGISDSVDRSEREPSPLKAVIEESDDNFDGDLPDQHLDDGIANETTKSEPLQPLKEHTDASNARIQQSMNEAKERFEKVNQWHRKLKPILLESEMRNHFDIHAYGTEIIDTFDPDAPLGGQSITLETVLENKPPHSTARFFLSMLMLANTNNVQICNKNADPLCLTSTADIELRLLSRKRHHQELEEHGVMIPAVDGCNDKQQKRQHRKRKILPLGQQDELERGGESRTEGARQILDPTRDNFDNDAFLDNVQQMYATMNREDSHQKRMAFRRGMRNCAYGLVDHETNKTAKEIDHDIPPQPPPPTPQEQLHHDILRTNPPKSSPLRPPANRSSYSSRDEAFGSNEELLSVDLLTNHVTFVPVLNCEPMYAKSVSSESGYESMLNGDLSDLLLRG